MLSELSVARCLSNLADRTPTPGGGAAAALAAATAAALVGMVSAYTTGGRWPERESRMREINAEAARLRGRALALADADVAAFGLVRLAHALPPGAPERVGSIQAALIGAAEPPARVGYLASRLVDLCDELVDSGNPDVVSDVAVAAASARAALDAAAVNIAINARGITDAAVVARLDAAAAEATRAAGTAASVVDRIMATLQR